MSEVQEHRRITAYDLANAIGTYISDNRNSRSVEDRWLASYLTEPLRITRLVRNNNLDRAALDEVKTFRLAEIAEEKKRRLREIDDFDREAHSLTKADAS